MTRHLTALILLVSLILGSAGCQPMARTQFNPQSTLKIVTSFYPVYIMTINVTQGVEGVAVTNMTPAATGCLHDYQLTPQNMITLSQANILVINGSDMESFIARVSQERPDLKVISASEGIVPLKNRDGTVNPHLWVSLEGAIAETRNICRQLSALDPDHAVAYQKNCESYIARLEALQERMKSELQGIKDKNIVTFHEAFPYLARDLGLNIVAVVENEPGSEPSPKELATLMEIIRKTNTRALFIEPQYPGQSAQTVARETGARIYTLDPAVTGPENANAYLEIMDFNIKALKEALL